MSKFLLLLCYLAVGAFSSFIILGICTLNLSALLGTLIWLLCTVLVSLLLVRSWRKRYPKEDKIKIDTEVIDYERFYALEGKIVEFEYCNKKNIRSQRKVKVKDVSNAGYISGYCLGSNAPRTFIIDNVIGNIIDTETGEIF